MSTQMSDLLGALDRGERTYEFQCPQCDAFPFETAVDLAEHHFTDHVGAPIVEVTYVPTTSAPSTPPANIRTDKQSNFIRTLLAEREGNPEAEVIRERLNHYRQTDGYVTKAAASGAITDLLKITKNGHGQMGLHEAPTTSTTSTTADVADGRYAVDTADGNEDLFVRVNHGKEGGRWAGYVFVSRLLGAPGDFREVPIRDRGERARILSAIGADPAAASVRFGQQVGYCGRCNSPLTDPTSRERGIGPVCAEKGW